MIAKKMNIEEFVDILASAAPTPGGGGAAALCGAVAAAVGNMAASLTVGKKKYADVEDEIKALQVKCSVIQSELIEMIDEDARAFEPLSKCYRLPKDTPEQAEFRESEMERCSKAACEVPLKIMKKCCQAIDIIEVFAAKGSRLAVSDAGCAAILAKAALQAASLNVFINTKTMKDRPEAETYNAKVREMLYIYEGKADVIFEEVQREVSGAKKAKNYEALNVLLAEAQDMGAIMQMNDH